MSESPLDLLREAISKRIAAVISLPVGSAFRHFKTRFLAHGDGLFLVQSIPAEPALLEKVLAGSAHVGIAFRDGGNKGIFTSVLIPRAAAQPADVLAVKYPREVHVIQRRSSYRVTVADDSQVEVRVWKIPDHAILRDRPSAAFEIGAKLTDLSVGGLGLSLETTGEPPLAVDQRLRVILHFGEEEALLDARVRHAHDQPDKTQRVGAQFKKLENDLEGRQTQSKLSAIVAHLQRQEILRARLKEEIAGLNMQTRTDAA
ncbi:MAG TPA: PilZ domain-containing protein [Tepidisphaeraceae bacterium]|jgi:c-di-GMP-binding flagellar brake protein YcgR|nr:PilZ domain-containing protein [Tepidisphaeraceae bacterium]